MANFNFNWTNTDEVNQDLLKCATEVIQAQERLQMNLRVNKASVNDKLFDKCTRLLDEYRDVKAEIDGTAIKFKKTEINLNILTNQIRPIILMQLPNTLTPDVKDRLTELVQKAFGQTCKQVIFIGLITCPWYESTQNDRGLAAKHNSLFVVYVSHEEQFFSPVNLHVREQSEVVDEGWFYGAEMFHYANYLAKGKSRFVEALFLPEDAIIYQHPLWSRLLETLDRSMCARLKGFMEQCRGQAAGAVGKKKKSGKFLMRDTATLYEFCESFRLLHHASNVIGGDDPIMRTLPTFDPSKMDYAMKSLQLAFGEDPQISKSNLFDIVMDWKKSIDKEMSNFVATPPKKVEILLGKWMTEVRAGPNFIPKTLTTDKAKHDLVKSLLDKVGGPLKNADPSQILMIAQAGSFLYGLDTPTSDVDYVVIYATPTEELLATCKRPTESMENRGPQLMCEYGAYEARLLAEMLWKGSVVMLELAFASGLEYTSPAWQTLYDNRCVLLTERAILQYFGLIKNNMVSIRSEKYKDNVGREKKLFYQIFHKLWSLEYMINGIPPPVRCDGETRDFIMNIRTGNLEGNFSRDRLKSKAEAQISSLRTMYAQRSTRLPENVHYDFLTQWLLSVRGLSDNDL